MNKIISSRAARRALAAAAALLTGGWIAAGSAIPASAAPPLAPLPQVPWRRRPPAGRSGRTSTSSPRACRRLRSRARLTRSPASRSPTSSAPSATPSSSRPAPTDRPPTPLIFQVGYYTTVAGLGLNPGDVTINGSIDVYNQCFATQQLHRARQLLALAVEPHDQRGRRHGLPGGDGLLGGLAGRAAAPSRRQRQAVPDGLLQRLSGLRQRRVHRRFPVHRVKSSSTAPSSSG